MHRVVNHSGAGGQQGAQHLQVLVHSSRVTGNVAEGKQSLGRGNGFSMTVGNPLNTSLLSIWFGRREDEHMGAVGSHGRRVHNLISHCVLGLLNVDGVTEQVTVAAMQ